MADLNEVTKIVDGAPLRELFAIRMLCLKEMEKRAWQVLRELGYQPYREESISLANSSRGKVEIVTITAEFEQNHEKQHIVHEMPMVQFGLLLQRDFQA